MNEERISISTLTLREIINIVNGMKKGLNDEVNCAIESYVKQYLRYHMYTIPRNVEGPLENIINEAKKVIEL